MIFSVKNELNSISSAFTKTISRLHRLVEETDKQIDVKKGDILQLEAEKKELIDHKEKALTFKNNLENLFK